MPITIEDLSQDEKIEYWNRLEVYARRGREIIVRNARLRKRMEASGVDAATRDDVVAKEAARWELFRGSAPQPAHFQTD